VLEIREALHKTAVEILTLEAFPEAPEVIEDGETLEANAVKKALTIHQHTRLSALGDDTGLFVEALRGAPGVYDPVFTVAGKNRTYAEMELAEKNIISHRGRALAEFKKLLAQLGLV
jgi:XTP/dITP diphosphohydrolase